MAASKHQRSVSGVCLLILHRHSTEPKVLILLSQRRAKMSKADVPDFKLRSSQLIPATTHPGHLTLSPGKQPQKLLNGEKKKKKNRPEYQGHLDGDKEMRTMCFFLM